MVDFAKKLKELQDWREYKHLTSCDCKNVSAALCYEEANNLDWLSSTEKCTCACHTRP